MITFNVELYSIQNLIICIHNNCLKIYLKQGYSSWYKCNRKVKLYLTCQFFNVMLKLTKLNVLCTVEHLIADTRETRPRSESKKIGYSEELKTRLKNNTTLILAEKHSYERNTVIKYGPTSLNKRLRQVSSVAIAI